MINELFKWAMVILSTLGVGFCLAVFVNAPKIARFPRAIRTLLVGVMALLSYIAHLFVQHEDVLNHVFWQGIVSLGMAATLASLFVLNYEIYQEEHPHD